MNKIFTFKNAAFAISAFKSAYYDRNTHQIIVTLNDQIGAVYIECNTFEEWYTFRDSLQEKSNETLQRL